MYILSKLLRKYVSLPTTQILRHKSSYVVLIPEVQDAGSETSFLNFTNGLPNFSDLNLENCYSGMGKLSLNYESALWAYEQKLINEKNAKTFKDVIKELELLEAPLTAAWGTVKTLYTVKNNLITTLNYMKIHERARRARANKFQSEALYKCCQDIYNTDKSLDGTQQRVLKNILLQGYLNGSELPVKERDHLNNTLKTLEDKKRQFRMKLKQISEKFSYRIMDFSIVRDFPVYLLKSMAFDRNEHLKGPWTVTHSPLVYPAFLEYCPDRELRWNAWNGYISRCSSKVSKEFQTSVDVEEIRDKRQEQAKLLGFKNFVEMSMQTKMAGTLDNILNVLSLLSEKAKLRVKEDLKSLKDFAESEGGHKGDLAEYDVPFWRRKYLEYCCRSSDLRNYFPFSHVWSQLLHFTSTIFCIHFEEVPKEDASRWHSDVRLYKVLDSSDSIQGYFYLDPYYRPGEKLVAYPESNWMLSMWGRSRDAGTIPVSSLIFNFPTPQEGKESLLTFQDVRSLFKKFGHALSHLLSSAPYSQVSGVNNVEWDAVEVSSNFLMNWVYEPSLLKKLGKHHKTGDELSDGLIKDIIKTGTHFSAYDLCYELFISHLDLKLYSEQDYWFDIQKEVWPLYMPFDLDKNYSLPCWFSPIISELWAAGFYSNVWSKMLAADAIGAFKESHPSDWPVVGQRYRDTFLSLGGGCHPSEVFRKFRGRDPNPEAFQGSLETS